jgi:soluble lytic murein transglycosylase
MPKPTKYSPTAIDMVRLSKIESSENPNAYNKGSGARGLVQITKPALDEWNQYHPESKYSQQQLFDPNVNMEVGTWYMTQRIPQMLQAYNIPITPDTMLWAYNVGIGRVRAGVKPTETVNYINKYNATT